VKLAGINKLQMPLFGRIYLKAAILELLRQQEIHKSSEAEQIRASHLIILSLVLLRIVSISPLNFRLFSVF